MARIQQIKHPDGDVIYPISHTNAIIDDSGNRLENVLQDLKQNSSIWNIELGSGVFVNRPDLLVDIKLGSGVWIGSDAPIFISSDDGIKISDSIRITQMRGIEISNSIKICTDIYIGSDVYIGTSPLDSNGGVYIGTDVYIEHGFDSRNVSGGLWTETANYGLESLSTNRKIILGSHLSIGDNVEIGNNIFIGSGFDSRNISSSGENGLWRQTDKYGLQSVTNKRNIQLGTDVYIGDLQSIVKITASEGIYVGNQNACIFIGSNVAIGTCAEFIEISSSILKINSNDNSTCYIEINQGFKTNDYFNISAKKIIPAALPFENLSNGNIKIGDTLFMPATPSGDPMHYAYETAGAEYNATTAFIVKDAPWKDMVDTIEDKAKWGFDVVDASQVKQMTINGTVYNYVQTTRHSPEGTTEPRYFLVGQASNGTWVEDETKVLHLPGHWYLNGLGDITRKELALIYENCHIVKDLAFLRTLQTVNIRTFFPLKNSTWYSQFNTSTLQGFYYSKAIEAVRILGGIHLYNTEHPNDRAPSINDEYGFVNNVVLKYLPQHRIIKTNAQTYKSATKLHVVPVVASQVSLYFSDIIQVSKNSILYVINNAVPTTPITITLHTDRYAQLSEDADVVAALEAKNAALEGTGGSISLVSA